MKRFENGFDSYKKAIEELGNRNADEIKLKAVVINFHHAIEVLFKHILCAKSKCLILKDLTSWVKSEFSQKLENKRNKNENSDHTICFDETIKRVFVIYDEKIDQYTYNGFYNLNQLRNALTHDEVELTIETVEQIVVTLAPIVTSLLNKHLVGEEKKEFESFVLSEQYEKVLRGLIGNNLVWRITTISGLLVLYYNKEFDKLSADEIRHLESTLSTLNCLAVREETFCKVDDEYYLTYVSYLKRQICDLLVLNWSDLEENVQVHNVIKRTGIIRDIMQEYLVSAVLYTINLMNNREGVPLEEKSVYQFLENNSFANNNDIFMSLQCVEKIKRVFVVLADTPKNKNVFDKIQVDGFEEQSLETILSALNSWFSKNNWISVTNKNALDKNIQEEIKSDKVLDNIFSRIWEDNILDELIGEYGEYAIIDKIDGITVEEWETAAISGNNITLAYNVSFEQQTYYDHEFFDTGTYHGLVEVDGHMNDNQLVIDKISFIGRPVGFENFRTF